MCLAGVYGGAHSGVSEGTTSVLLEAAWFHPVTVRKPPSVTPLSTDASFRFERGVDPKSVRLGRRTLRASCCRNGPVLR